MANKSRISHFTVELTEILHEKGVLCKEELTPSNALVKRFIRIGKAVPDSRKQGMIQYPLVEILLIAFFAVLSGAETWTQMATYGKVKKEWLQRFLKFKNGIPSHDTFRRVFSLIHSDILQQLTVDFLMDNINRIKAALGITNTGVRLINVDGKQGNGTGRKRSKNGVIPNLQMLNVYDASSGICLMMKDIDCKTNEIPAAQEILPLLNLKDSVVTCDALNTQKETVRIIREQKGDYVMALKKNHQLFYDEVDQYFSEDCLRSIQEKGTYYFHTLSKAHSQGESRHYYMTTDVKWFADKKDWKDLRALVCYEKICTDPQSGISKKERYLYISSLKDVELCAEAIRGHWSVENVLHWHLDVSFGDDRDMTIDRAAYMNFTLFRRLALTLCKISQTFIKESVKTMRWMIGIETNQVLGTILGTLDETFLENALRDVNTKK